MADAILEIHSEFPFPPTFADTLFEMVNIEFHFAKQMSTLTDVKVENEEFDEVITLHKYFKEKMLETK